MKKQDIIFYIVIAAAFVELLLKAWVSEDAFITARVIDNFVNGFGLRWNPDERVQVYTHPLWMMIQIPFYAITREFFYTNIFISISTIAICVFLMLRHSNITAVNKVILFILPLMLSKSFSDYATSGLENPMTYLLLLLFAISFFKDKQNWLMLGVVSSLILLNRIDIFILILPCFIYILWVNKVHWLALFAGFIPFGLWVLFCFFYYGSPIPNTFWAKLYTGLSFGQKVDLGFNYFTDFLRKDLFSFLFIVSVLITSIVTKHPHRKGSLLMCIGSLLYMAYTILAGGDFMTGRFFAAPFFFSVLALLFMVEYDSEAIYRRSAGAMLIIFAVSALLGAPKVNIYEEKFDSANFIDEKTKIHDERLWSWQHNHLINFPFLNRVGNYKEHHFYKKGLRYSKKVNECCFVTEYYAVGMFGYSAKEKVIIIDNFAITDPLLSKLPMPKTDSWYWPGHYYRTTPAGYKQARKSGKTNNMDNDLTTYYNKLRLVTSGNLLDPERFMAIIDLNMGKFDSYLESFTKKYSKDH